VTDDTSQEAILGPSNAWLTVPLPRTLQTLQGMLKARMHVLELNQQQRLDWLDLPDGSYKAIMQLDDAMGNDKTFLADVYATCVQGYQARIKHFKHKLDACELTLFGGFVRDLSLENESKMRQFQARWNSFRQSTSRDKKGKPKFDNASLVPGFLKHLLKRHVNNFAIQNGEIHRFLIDRSVKVQLVTIKHGDARSCHWWSIDWDSEGLGLCCAEAVRHLASIDDSTSPDMEQHDEQRQQEERLINQSTERAEEEFDKWADEQVNKYDDAPWNREKAKKRPLSSSSSATPTTAQTSRPRWG
jgi:hypothetical protein